MLNTPKELLHQYVNRQSFSSTNEIMAAMEDIFRDVIQQVILSSEKNVVYKIFIYRSK